MCYVKFCAQTQNTSDQNYSHFLLVKLLKCFINHMYATNWLYLLILVTVRPPSFLFAYTCNAPTPSFLIGFMSSLSRWVHLCLAADPLRLGGLKELFSDPTNHHIIPCFLLTCTVPTITFRKVTHPKIAPAQGPLTMKFSQDSWQKR